MRTKKQLFISLSMMSAGVLALTSCSSAPKADTKTVASYEKGVPGGIIVQTTEGTATVTAIDAATRKVTLLRPDGEKATFKAGPAVVNFNQIRVGDQVKATAVQELVVFMRKKGEPPREGEAAAVALAPVGEKPGAFMANTAEVTAKVVGLDLQKQKATVEFPDGKTKTFDVRKDVDLTKVNLGEQVVFRTTEAVAVRIERP